MCYYVNVTLYQIVTYSLIQLEILESCEYLLQAKIPELTITLCCNLGHTAEQQKHLAFSVWLHVPNTEKPLVAVWGIVVCCWCYFI